MNEAIALNNGCKVTPLPPLNSYERVSVEDEQHHTVVYYFNASLNKYVTDETNPFLPPEKFNTLIIGIPEFENILNSHHVKVSMSPLSIAPEINGSQGIKEITSTSGVKKILHKPLFLYGIIGLLILIILIILLSGGREKENLHGNEFHFDNTQGGSVELQFGEEGFEGIKKQK